MVGSGVVTATLTWAVAVPPVPVAVIVYVVVSAGDTEIEPLGSTVPISGSIVHDAASVDVHSKVALSPCTMVDGVDVMSTVGGGSVTVTVTSAPAVPPGPVATMLYWVVAVGETSISPFRSTTPISGSMTHDSACSELQLNSADWPVTMVSGAALNATVGGR